MLSGPALLKAPRVQVTAERALVRSKPEPEAPVVGYLVRGEVLANLRTAGGGRFVEVVFGVADRGWVATADVTATTLPLRTAEAIGGRTTSATSVADPTSDAPSAPASPRRFTAWVSFGVAVFQQRLESTLTKSPFRDYTVSFLQGLATVGAALHFDRAALYLELVGSYSPTTVFEWDPGLSEVTAHTDTERFELGVTWSLLRPTANELGVALRVAAFGARFQSLETHTYAGTRLGLEATTPSVGRFELRLFAHLLGPGYVWQGYAYDEGRSGLVVGGDVGARLSVLLAKGFSAELRWRTTHLFTIIPSGAGSGTSNRDTLHTIGLGGAYSL